MDKWHGTSIDLDPTDIDKGCDVADILLKLIEVKFSLTLHRQKGYVDNMKWQCG